MISQPGTASWRLASRLTVLFKGMLLTLRSVPQRLALTAYRLPGPRMQRCPVAPMCFLQCSPQPRGLGVGLLPFADLPFSGCACVGVRVMTDASGTAFRGYKLRFAMAALSSGPWVLI